MKIELHGVHLDKDNKLSVTYKILEAENSAPVQAGPFTGLVHEDLVAAMAKLSVHIALMTKQLNVGDIEDIENVPEILFADFTAKSFSESGEDGKKRVIISGNRKEIWKKVFNFNTPGFLIDEKEGSRYDFMDDVVKRIARIKVETLAFLDGTKRGTDPQGNLFAQKKQAPPVPSENITVAEKAKITKLQIAEPKENFVAADVVDKEWTAREYQEELRKSKLPNVKADPEAMKRIKEWEDSDKQNKTKAKAVANQPGAKGRKKGGAKRVKQTAENPSGILDETEETDAE